MKGIKRGVSPQGDQGRIPEEVAAELGLGGEWECPGLDVWAAGVGLCASEGRTAVAEAQTAQGSQWEGNGMAGGAVLRTF